MEIDNPKISKTFSYKINLSTLLYPQKIVKFEDKKIEYLFEISMFQIHMIIICIIFFQMSLQIFCLKKVTYLLTYALHTRVTSFEQLSLAEFSGE